MAINGIRTNKKGAIEALLTAESIEAAAGVAGVGERTLFRWLNEDVEFQAALREAQNQAETGGVSIVMMPVNNREI